MPIVVATCHANAKAIPGTDKDAGQVEIDVGQCSLASNSEIGRISARAFLEALSVDVGHLYGVFLLQIWFLSTLVRK